MEDQSVGDLQEYFLAGTQDIIFRRKEFLMQHVSRPEWYIRIRLYYRLLRLGLHILEGFLLAVFSGALFFQYKRFQQPVIRWWHKRLCQILNLDVRVHGRPVQTPALWVSNHISWMDIPVLGSLFHLYFLSKAEVADWPLLGSLAKSAGTLFIRRGSGDAGKVSSDLAGHLAGGRSVLFFPEGTTTDGHALKRFFHKLFGAAVDADCQIQPVLICYRHGDGLHPVAPFVGDDEFFSHALEVLRGEPIVVDVMVLPVEHIEGRDARAVSRHLEQLMGTALKELHDLQSKTSV